MEPSRASPASPQRLQIPNLVSLLALNGVLVAETRKYLAPGMLDTAATEG